MLDSHVRVWWPRVTIAIVLAASACKSTTDAPKPTTVSRFKDVAGALAVGQADSIGVKVSDAQGSPYAGAIVSFAVTAGGGAVSASSATSGRDGVASVYWTLSTTPGTQSVSASASLTGSPILFSVNAQADAAAALAKIGADVTTSIAATTIDSVRVLVTDRFNNPKPGAPVVFVVLAGGGSVSPSSVSTGADGRAAARWTVGRAANQVNTVTATTGSLSVVTFSTNSVSGPAAIVVKTGTDPATVTAGEDYDSIRVVVTDAAGNPKAGESVGFVVTSGGGSVSPTSVTTGVNGQAATRWTVGTSAAQVNTVTATRVGLPSVTFTTTVAAGPANAVTKVGTDPVNLSASAVVDSIRVLVTDRFGNARPGETVAFAVTAGAGSISPSTVTTGSDGRAAARWTLGQASSTLNVATATRAGFASVTFSTTTTVAAPTTVVLTTARILVVDVGATIVADFSVRDAGNLPMVGQPLVSISRGPAASYANGLVTGIRRGQTFIVVSSATNSLARDSVLVIVKTPGAPVLTTNLPTTDVAPNTLVTVTILADMRTSAERLGAGTVLVTWNPNQLTYVSNTDGASGVGATVNSANVATGAFTLAFASSAGLLGNVELRQITFRTTTTVGRTGTLSLLPTELTAAVTFSNLLLTTVSAFFPLVVR